jgi:hypothetical protein
MSMFVSMPMHMSFFILHKHELGYEHGHGHGQVHGPGHGHGHGHRPGNLLSKLLLSDIEVFLHGVSLISQYINLLISCLN